MWDGRKRYWLKAAEVAKELGLSTRAVVSSGILNPMSEEARQALISGLKKTRAPHGEPMVVGPGLAIQETEDEIRILIKKKLPQPEAVVRETPDVIAVRRAGGL